MAARRNSSGALMSQQVFETLQGEILERVRPPGSRLIEDAIAADLGVSRTPVREALRMLAREGWLDLHPHAGAYVRQPGIEEVRDIFMLRELLERESARLAAARRTDDDIRVLRKVVERGTKAVAKGTPKVLAALNSDFHRSVAAAAANLPLQRFIDELDKHVRWHFAAVATRRADASWREHAAIVDAIEREDGAEAARLSAEHARRTRDTYIEQVLQAGVPGDA
jgi:DNA-binding GntR family transcriptional regulator